ncbi:MAG TPA: hypothetical protein VG146_04915 [Verrucomicrobiae bacterium]|nr:hypothetical protein [Verrucomicrobiae bacterium]
MNCASILLVELQLMARTLGERLFPNADPFLRRRKMQALAFGLVVGLLLVAAVVFVTLLAYDMNFHHAA